MSIQQPDIRTAAQAVIDRWDTPKWKDAPATAGYIAALRDALAGEVTDMVGRWYMVARDGMAMLCVDREDAEAEARKADRAYPRNGPHRAVQLAPAGGIAALKGQRAVLCSLLRECLPVIDALMQMPGDDDSDARLNGLAGRITGALNALAEDQVKGGES